MCSRPIIRTYLVHLSSSVVESEAADWYTESKEQQERIVVQSGLSHVVLRPTLMFGWFDRKHLGWLARFMQRVADLSDPGQRPLSAPAALCRRPLRHHHVVHRQAPEHAGYNISGLEKIDYIDLMREVKNACGARAAIVRIPYSLFWALLWTYGLFDRDPPFTTKQLEALVTPDVFEVIDWPGIFGVKATPLRRRAGARRFSIPSIRKSYWNFSDMSRVAVIGAGAMGLAAAYHAAKQGHDVTVLEAAPEPGGMAAHFDFGGLSIERFYHFVCKADRSTFELLEELGIGDKMRWGPTSMGYFVDGKLLSLGRSGRAAAISQAVADRQAALRRADVPVDQAQRLGAA